MLALVLLLTSTAPSAVPDPMCARALRVAPALSCAAADHGVVLASAQPEADRLATYARAGEIRFSTRFERDIAPYVVVSTPPLPDRAALNKARAVSPPPRT